MLKPDENDENNALFSCFFEVEIYLHFLAGTLKFTNSISWVVPHMKGSTCISVHCCNWLLQWLKITAVISVVERSNLSCD
jgi:hypothetical protein